MRPYFQQLISGLAAALLATTALAQTTAPVTANPQTLQPQPTVAAPTPPQPPVNDAFEKADMQGKLMQNLNKSGNSAALGQAMAVGILLNCTQKQAGKDATQAFYTDIKQVGDQVKADCKANNAPAAQALVLQTLDAKQNDPVLKSALGCYDAQSETLNAMAGPQISDSFAHYARWARDPALAHQEMKPTDICKPATPK